MNELKISLTSSYSEVTPACRKLKAFFIGLGVPEYVEINIEICVNEALNNIIKHAYLGKPDNLIEIQATCNKSEIKIKIIDTGICRTNFERPKLNFNPSNIDNLPEGGMGLYIIDKLMDNTDYQIEGNKNIFTLTKKFSQES